MESKEAVAMLSALAHETRLALFRRLVEAGPDGLPAEALDVPGPTLSFHLKELKSAGVVRSQRDGRLRIYQPDFDAMRGLVAFLTQNCCAGSRRRRAKGASSRARAGARA